MPTQQAISTTSFIGSLGVNTHIDFDAYGYQNLSTVEAAINYLGLSNIRDSAQTASDASAWLQVAQATGAKFDDYIGETSPAGMQTDLGYVAQLAQEGILNYVEGGNEEDDAYPESLGNNLSITAQFQQQVYAVAHQYGLSAINMSFGAGWTAANDWHGDYDKVGNLSGVADYANAHTYPNAGQTPASSIQQLNSDALLAAGSRPVITTELGWNNSSFSQSAVAQYVVQGALDSMLCGDVKTYFYSLFDDSSGAYGLMNADGSARPAGTALHNLTTLLADTGGSFTAGSLNYTLGGTQSGDNTLLMQKSNGSDWLAVWNDSAGAHTVTLSLASTASQILIFDPVTGTSSTASANNASSISFSLGNDPLLVEVIPAGGVTAAPAISGSASSGSATSSAGATPGLTVPASETVAAGSTTTLTGISLSDATAASLPGTLALNVTATAGSVSMRDANGNPVSGSGTGAVHVSGTLAQIDAALATLTYTAGSSSGSVTVDIWDQQGNEFTRSIAVTLGASAAAASAASPDPVLTAPASATVATGSTAAISGVSLADPWAASKPGTLALNVTSSGGTVAMHDASGNAVSGSGTSGIHVSGTLSQINAELQTLSFTSGSNTGSITVDVWDQGGAEATKTIGVTGSASGASAPAAGGGITIAATDASPVENVSNTAITASAGDHMIFIGGTGDTLTATGGTETVQAYQGSNSITTGAGNDTVRIAGANNTINMGAGNNVLFDSGSSNTIVLPGADQGYDDLYGYLTTNGDQFDMRSMLAGTNWNGDLATIGNFVKLVASGNNTLVNVDPSGAGATYTVATLEGTGPVSLGTLLGHSIT